PFSLHFTREGEAAGRPVRTVSRSMRFPRPPVPRGDRVKPNNRALRLLAGATAVAASAAAAALSAAATPASAAACPPPPTVVQPFTPWQDANDYVMTTGGTFEPGAAPWTLSG